jgi:hypothetical protein
MDITSLYPIVSFAFALAVGYFTKWAQTKVFLKKVKRIVVDVVDGVDDDKVTETEWNQWLVDLKDLLGVNK